MDKNNVLVLHGSFGSPYENWFPWLHGEVAKSGGRCFVPCMPTPVGQTFENWAHIIDGYAEAGCLGQDTVIVAHSSACAFAVKYLTNRGLHVQRIVCVAGFNGFLSGNADFNKINAEFYITPEVLASANKYSRDIICFYSSTDPYLPLTTLSAFCSEIGGKAIEVTEGGHFNAAAGYSEFPLLLPHVI
ncbi:MAG: alpha/beta hydrolase [Nitrospirota bacterium]